MIGVGLPVKKKERRPFVVAGAAVSGTCCLLAVSIVFFRDRGVIKAQIIMPEIYTQYQTQRLQEPLDGLPECLRALTHRQVACLGHNLQLDALLPHTSLESLHGLDQGALGIPITNYQQPRHTAALHLLAHVIIPQGLAPIPESLHAVIGDHFRHPARRLRLGRHGMRVEPPGDRLARELPDSRRSVVAHALGHGNALLPSGGVGVGAGDVEVARHKPRQLARVREGEAQRGGAAHADADQGVQLLDAQRCEQGGEVVGHHVEGGWGGRLGHGEAAAVVVAQDAQVRAGLLEEDDEGVPHLQRGEEGVGEGDGRGGGVRVAFELVGDAEAVGGGDEGAQDGLAVVGGGVDARVGRDEGFLGGERGEGLEVAGGRPEDVEERVGAAVLAGNDVGEDVGAPLGVCGRLVLGPAEPILFGVLVQDQELERRLRVQAGRGAEAARPQPAGHLGQHWDVFLFVPLIQLLLGAVQVRNRVLDGD